MPDGVPVGGASHDAVDGEPNIDLSSNRGEIPPPKIAAGRTFRPKIDAIDDAMMMMCLSWVGVSVVVGG